MSAMRVARGASFLLDDGDRIVGYLDAGGLERDLSGNAIRSGDTPIPAGSAGLMAWAYAQSFQLVSATRDANGAITTASIVWPDGTTGVFTTDTASTAFPGAIDAWHATYLSTPTKTATQPAVTRDSNGAVTAQPTITIS